MVDRDMVELNKLIAMFMGAIPNGKHPDVYGLLKTKENTKPYQVCWVSLRYDGSWDWLMPVLKKLSGICQDEDNVWRLSPGWTAHKNILHYLTEYDIEAVHMHVVEFIKWYNEQKDDK